MMLALALAATLAVADPRPPIVELALAGETARALEMAERALDEDPRGARSLGLDYLRADLLERAGRQREAAEGFARAMAAPPALLPWARYRAARVERALGRPDAAAGLAAALLAAAPPAGLVRPGLELLRRTLADGGDCGRLEGIARERLPAGERRRFDLLRAECLARDGHAEPARQLALRLLVEESGDSLARDAAELVARLPGEPRDRPSAELLGRAAFEHREFEVAAVWLERALAGRAPGARTWELGYALARSEFWLGRYGKAAARFRALAAEAPGAERRASALHQAGRALELAGEAQAAKRAFADAAAVEPANEWTSAALLSGLRLAALEGDEARARGLLARLSKRRAGSSAFARGALFLAAGDLVRGRTAHAAEDLAAAARTRTVAEAEIAYWRGRLEEARGAAGAAVGRYLEALENDPFHPFARAARARLARPELAATARGRAAVEAAAHDPRALRRAALLLDALGSEELDPLRRRGREALARQASAALWLNWERAPVADWPLWTASTHRPEELLVGLGRLSEAPGEVTRRFPAARPALAFTGAALLAADGATTRSLAVVEGLFGQRPRDVPVEWIAPELRRLLYPFPWRSEIRAEAAARGIDAWLLVALIREESRFDPRALSPAAARGLTQFVLPTARRIASLAGLPPPGAEDLDRPEVAIALGAAYLGELSGRFESRVELMAAAYNAGEDQAALWRRYCFSQEPEEFLSKVGFRETRSYVQRVLGGREQYADLYPPEGVP